MTVVPVGFYEASVEITIPGDAGPAAVVFGGDFGPALNAQAIANFIAGDLQDAAGIRLMMDGSSVFSTVTVRANFGGPDLYIASAVINAAGTSAGAALPPNVATLMTKSTGSTGRHNRGRMYLPGVAEGVINEGGFLEAGVQAAYQLAASTFFNSLAADQIPMHILHGDAAIPPTLVLQLLVRDKCATQRRRLR